MNTKSFLILLITGVIFFASCKNDKGNKTDDIVVDNQEEQFVYPLPTPFEVTQMLQSSGTAFNMDLTNPAENAQNYIEEKAQALNMGVYGADLAYASTYNQAQSVRDLLVAAKSLADNIGLTNVMDQSIVERIESNIQNEDTLYKIVNNTFYSTFDQLNKEGKGSVSLLVITGAWIESLYLATQLAITSQDNSIIMEKVAEQKYNINTLMPLLAQYKDDTYISEIIPIADSFKQLFDQVEADSLGNVIIMEETFDQLTQLAKTERDKITNM